MTWSLHIRNGDLNLGGPGGYATVTGAQKLIQDLKHLLSTPLGSDPMHPDYGSSFDGGLLPDGTIVEPQIGGILTGEALLAVESEIRTRLNLYQEQQLARLNREAPLYGGKNTFSQGEILVAIDDVTVQQVADVVLAKITLRTEDGNALSISSPVA